MLANVVIGYILVCIVIGLVGHVLELIRQCVLLVIWLACCAYVFLHKLRQVLVAEWHAKTLFKRWPHL